MFQDSIDLDRSRRLAIVEALTVLDRCRSMMKAAHSGMPLQVAVYLTVKPARFGPFFKPINGLRKLLMIEWE